MVKTALLLISAFCASVVPAAEPGDIQNAWKTFLPVKKQKPSVEELLWLEGDWTLAGKNVKPQREAPDYDKIIHIEIWEVPYGVGTAPVSGETLIDFAGFGFGKYDKEWKQEVMVYRATGYYSGSFCLGHRGQCDAFELRKEAKSTPNAFVIRHEVTGDTLLFQRAKKFHQFDANMDGKLDLQEQEAERASRAAWEAKKRARQRQFDLEHFDANHDGQLDATEQKARDRWYAEHQQEHIKKYDRNGNGKIAPEEIRSLVPSPNPPKPKP